MKSVGRYRWRRSLALSTTCVVTVKRIVSSTHDCIAVEADSDFGPEYKTKVDVNRNIGIVLQRNLEPTPEVRRINPSNWVQTFGGTLEAGKTLEKICE